MNEAGECALLFIRPVSKSARNWNIVKKEHDRPFYLLLKSPYDHANFQTLKKTPSKFGWY